MSASMEEDGRQILARGRIRVDARRALAKLREHLLVDLHLYAVEIARAAIAAKATFLDADYDTDDVVLTFDGQPIAPNELPRLLDHVLGDGHSTDRALRGLALGVNAALGLGPAFVDIYVRMPQEKRASRVRFVPAVLQSEDHDWPEIEMVTPPKTMPERGMQVHVRRRMTMATLKRVATREVPREIVLLSDALHVAPISLTSLGAAMPMAPRRPALLRVPFRENGLRRGILEILATPAGSQIEYLELGVLLLRKPFAPEPILPSTPHARVELPLRVIIDADELPTNASRSALREDSNLPKRAEHAAREALVLALRTLVALVTRKGEALPAVEIVDRDPKKLEDALGAIACVVAGALRRSADVSEQARALLDLPLLQNAVGTSISPAKLLERQASDVFVYDSKEPHSKDLEPWLEDVVWLKGKMAENMLVDFAVQDSKSLVASANLAHERRRRLHARPRSEPVVPADEGHLVKDTFRIEDGPFKGLRGQLALGAEGQRTGERPTTIRFYVEGRHIDTLTIDRDKLPLAIDAAIAWDKRIKPKFSYDGVIDDADLRRAILQLTRLALQALGTYFERSLQEKRAAEERARVAPIARAAVAAFALAAGALGVETPPEEPPLHAYLPIWTRSIWPSADPNRLPLSLSELKTYSDRTKAICFAPPGVSGVAPDGRPVLVATDLERSWLEKVFPGVTFVPYARALRPKDAPSVVNTAMFDSLRAAPRKDGAPAEMLPSMNFDLRDGRGIIAPAAEDSLSSLHAGVLLCSNATNKFVEPATIILEHDTTVPNPAWDGILWSRDSSVLTTVRNELLLRIVSALEGDAAARSSLRDFPAEPGPLLRAYLIEAVPRFRTKELAPRLENLPLVHVLDPDGRPRLTSLAEVAARFPNPQPIPFLRAPPPFPTFDWYPLLLVRDREVSAVLRWAGNRVQEALQELDKRSQLAHGELLRRAFLEKTEIPLDDPGPQADPSLPAMVWQEEPSALDMPVAIVVAALPRVGIEPHAATVEVFYQKRYVCSRVIPSLPVPVVARVHLPSERLLQGYSDLVPEAIPILEGFVYAAACALAADLVIRAGGDASAAFLQERRGLALIRALYACSVDNPSRSDILKADFALRAPEFLWPTVQGEQRSFTELVPGGGKLYCAIVRYGNWEKSTRGGSELDAPILYVPTSREGELLREILRFMGQELIDVSNAIVDLQARRRPGTQQAGPALPGKPEHPALRATLSALGFDLDGEIEIVEASRADVRVETLRGQTISLQVTAAIPFLAIVRVEDIELDDQDKRTLGEKLAKAALKLIESVAERLDELPLFVRSSLRMVVVKHADKGKNLSKRRRSMPVFPDIFGGFRSILDLTEDDSTHYPFVTALPSQPVPRRPRPPILLTNEEHQALATHVPLHNVTASIQREATAQERRHAAPLEFIGLSTTQRLECLDVIPHDGDEQHGAIGLLAPEHAQKRGIFVYKQRRPLCKLPDQQSWPVLAIINDDSVPENKTFDGIRGNAAKDRLRRSVRTQAEKAFEKWFVIPEAMIAGRQIQSVTIADALLVMGALWLPPSWTRARSVEVRDSSNRLPTPRSFVVSNLDFFEGTIPVCGRLFIAPKFSGKKHSPKELADVQAELTNWVLQLTTSMVLEATEAGEHPQDIEGYRWILDFLGADAGPLDVVSTDGRRIKAGEIIGTIRLRKEIWVARGDGDVEGQFPASPPPFLLRDDGHPLVPVLRQRTRVVRDFAAAPPPEPVRLEVQTEATAPEVPPAPPEPLVPQTFVVPNVVEAPVEAPREAPPEVEPATTWFRHLVQRVVVFFDPPEPIELWTEALGPSLTSAIDKLGLAPTKVLQGVRYVRKGRPLVFDQESGQLVINRAHPAVRKLAAKVSDDPRARLLFVVAAVREINRVLDVVTDATERRVLLSLLRGEPL